MQISDGSSENHPAVYWRKLWAVALLVKLMMMMFDFKAHLWKDYCADQSRGMWRHWVLCKSFCFFLPEEMATLCWDVSFRWLVWVVVRLSLSLPWAFTCEPRGPNTENILDRQVQKVTTPPFSSSLSFTPSLVYSVSLCLSSLLRVIYTSCDVIGAVTRATPTHSFKNTKSDRDASLFSSLRNWPLTLAQKRMFSTLMHPCF